MGHTVLATIFLKTSRHPVDDVVNIALGTLTFPGRFFLVAILGLIDLVGLANLMFVTFDLTWYRSTDQVVSLDGSQAC